MQSLTSKFNEKTSAVSRNGSNTLVDLFVIFVADAP